MTSSRAHRFLLTVAMVVMASACADTTTDPVSSAEVPLAAAQAATTLTYGDFALHIPANVKQVRGILLTLGGPNTQGFALGSGFNAPPFIEPLLQVQAAGFQELAAERGLAILGSRVCCFATYPDSPATDQAILAAIAQGATLSGHPELANAPILIYAISGGAPEGLGFTQRNPARVQALFLKVPAITVPLTGPALQVPAHMVLAEFDALLNNGALQAIFATHRAAGAPWGLSIDPGVQHISLSDAQRDFTLDWMRAILPLGNAAPFRGTSPKVGFLGDRATGEIASVQAFKGNLAAASWFPNRALAMQWKAFNDL